LSGGDRTPAIRVIAFGNPAAGDDAAGLIAVSWARKRLEAFSSVEVVEAGPGFRALDLLEGADAVVAVDAVQSPVGRRRPGRLVRGVATAEGFGADLTPALSSHGFGLAEAIGLATALGARTRVVFVGVEAGDVTMGRPLSAPVAASLPRMVEMILEEVREQIARSEATA